MGGGARNKKVNFLQFYSLENETMRVYWLKMLGKYLWNNFMAQDKCHDNGKKLPKMKSKSKNRHF